MKSHRVNNDPPALVITLRADFVEQLARYRAMLGDKRINDSDLLVAAARFHIHRLTEEIDRLDWSYRSPVAVGRLAVGTTETRLAPAEWLFRWALEYPELGVRVAKQLREATGTRARAGLSRIALPKSLRRAKPTQPDDFDDGFRRRRRTEAGKSK